MGTLKPNLSELKEEYVNTPVNLEWLVPNSYGAVPLYTKDKEVVDTILTKEEKLQTTYTWKIPSTKIAKEELLKYKLKTVPMVDSETDIIAADAKKNKERALAKKANAKAKNLAKQLAKEKEVQWFKEVMSKYEHDAVTGVSSIWGTTSDSSGVVTSVTVSATSGIPLHANKTYSIDLGEPVVTTNADANPYITMSAMGLYSNPVIKISDVTSGIPITIA